DPPDPVASMFVERLFGSKWAGLFTVMVLWTAVGSVFALMLGYSRIPYAAARSGVFFSVFGRLHPTKDFPHWSLLVIGAVSIACSFLPLMTVIDALLLTRILVQFIGQIGAVILLRRRVPEMDRPYRMWLYPMPCFVALIGWLFLFGTAGRTLISFGVATLLAGIVCFLFWSRLSR